MEVMPTILLNDISDHTICFTFINNKYNFRKVDKVIDIIVNGEFSIERYRNELKIF